MKFTCLNKSSVSIEAGQNSLISTDQIFIIGEFGPLKTHWKTSERCVYDEATCSFKAYAEIAPGSKFKFYRQHDSGEVQYLVSRQYSQNQGLDGSIHNTFIPISAVQPIQEKVSNGT